MIRLELIKNGMNNWLPKYILDYIFHQEGIDSLSPVHVIFCFVDHFEPFNGGVNYETAKTRVHKCLKDYERIASKFKDADGKMPKHTWFYPPHHDQTFLKDLVETCKQGFGEVELHLHHNHMQPFPDTSKTLKDKILKSIDNYSKLGIFLLPNEEKTFGFIHGDWSLDNSRGSKICGVNNELTILKECGCYADFTFPCMNEAQPAMINKIYYVKDGLKNTPKSYNRGKPVVVGGKSWGDLLMIPGIIGFRRNSEHGKSKFFIEASNIDNTDTPVPNRVDFWVKNSIKVKGNSNWLFIKIHTHGAVEDNHDAVYGHIAERMYDYLISKYNDKKNYFLHFVSAREMYNIIKAAEAGKNGNAGKFRDYLIPKYVYLNNDI